MEEKAIEILKYLSENETGGFISVNTKLLELYPNLGSTNEKLFLDEVWVASPILANLEKSGYIKIGQNTLGQGNMTKGHNRLDSTNVLVKITHIGIQRLDSLITYLNAKQNKQEYHPIKKAIMLLSNFVIKHYWYFLLPLLAGVVATWFTKKYL